MNFTPMQLKIMAVSAAVTRLNQPMIFNVLHHILKNRSLQQEMNYEEEVSSRSVGAHIPGRHPDWDKRPSTALMTRLLLGLLPESVLRVLWHSLIEHYSVTPPEAELDDEVPFAPTS